MSSPGNTYDTLATAITLRSVQRSPLMTWSLVTAEKQALAAAVGPAYSPRRIEGFKRWLNVALPMFGTAKLRLTMPEAYPPQRSVIDRGQRYSRDKLPVQALGAGALRLLLWRFVLGSCAARAFFQSLPGWGLAAALAVGFVARASLHRARHRLGRTRPTKRFAVGGALQSYWPTATALGLWHQLKVMQPIFSSYLRQGIRLTCDQAVTCGAAGLLPGQAHPLGDARGSAVWMRRISAFAAPRSRPTRLPPLQLRLLVQTA